MFALGLDLALENSGYCIYNIESDKFIEIGSIHTNKQQPLYKRLDDIVKKISLLGTLYSFKCYGIEQQFVNPKRMISTIQVLRVGGVVVHTLGDTELIEKPPTTIKKYITGNGKSTKDEVRKRILEKYPDLIFKNNDESDSVAILVTCLDLWKEV